MGRFVDGGMLKQLMAMKGSQGISKGASSGGAANSFGRGISVPAGRGNRSSLLGFLCTTKKCRCVLASGHNLWARWLNASRSSWSEIASRQILKFARIWSFPIRFRLTRSCETAYDKLAKAYISINVRG